jgi:hypothetical protein
MARSAESTSDAAYYGIPFALAFALSVVMLATDKNLQTDFGTLSSGYYFHWYVVLIAAIADILGAFLLFWTRSRKAVLVGTIGSGLLAAIFVGDIFTYSQVGFASASDFANYLFGITFYGGDIRYLYDVVLAVYVLTFLWGVVVLWRMRRRRASAPPAGSVPPPTP